ncbi:MAG TPA: hypothetical protein VLS85_02885 [Hanamia sp.]|nr:hypothetical protein [Hanamia sp.]
MDQYLNKKIDEAMQSLDGIENASPRPFFFTRLEARMQREKSRWEVISSFVAKPIVAFACICLIILINTAVILSSANSKNVTDQQNSEQATADEYNSVSAPLYEFVNSTP